MYKKVCQRLRKYGKVCQKMIKFAKRCKSARKWSKMQFKGFGAQYQCFGAHKCFCHLLQMFWHAVHIFWVQYKSLFPFGKGGGGWKYFLGQHAAVKNCCFGNISTSFIIFLFLISRAQRVNLTNRHPYNYPHLVNRQVQALK